MFKIHSNAWMEGYNAVIEHFNQGTPADTPSNYTGQDLADWVDGANAARHLYNIA